MAHVHNYDYSEALERGNQHLKISIFFDFAVILLYEGYRRLVIGKSHLRHAIHYPFPSSRTPRAHHTLFFPLPRNIQDFR
jgi:hypothetical protein